MALTHPYGVQLYSARNFPPVEEQLATIVRRGFTNVETFGPFYEDAAKTKRLLDAHNLTVRSGHFSLDMIENQSERTIDVAEQLGVDIVVAPYLAPTERPADIAGWRALGSRLARLRDIFAGKRLRFAWHNHDFEFVALPDGSTPIEHVLGAHLLWEADIAWIVRGEADPTYWIRRYAGRMPLVHVKDLAPMGENVSEDGWADVGAGILPWADLWRQCVEAGAEIMVAEHDLPSDFDRFARVSAEAMRRFNGKA